MGLFSLDPLARNKPKSTHNERERALNCLFFAMHRLNLGNAIRGSTWQYTDAIERAAHKYAPREKEQ